jgi:hypothetical protein
MTDRIYFVSAPGIPQSEREALEGHVRESILDPQYNIVTNYKFTVKSIPRPDLDKYNFSLAGVGEAFLREFLGLLEEVRQGRGIVVFPFNVKLVKKG